MLAHTNDGEMSTQSPQLSLFSDHARLVGHADRQLLPQDERPRRAWPLGRHERVGAGVPRWDTHEAA